MKTKSKGINEDLKKINITHQMTLILPPHRLWLGDVNRMVGGRHTLLF